MKKLFYSFVICGLLCAAIGVKAQDLNITGTTTITHSSGLYTIPANGGTYNVTMVTSGSSTTNRIAVSGTGTVNITLTNVTIEGLGDGLNAFNILSSATVNLTLFNDNTLKGGISAAGLRVPTDASLHIRGSGKLEVVGGDGKSEMNAGAGAGIGGNGGSGAVGETSGSIYIGSSSQPSNFTGTITATGGNAKDGHGGGGAGIGGGGGGNGGGGGSNGTIYLYSGHIIAKGGDGQDNGGGGAGIGGGGGGNREGGNNSATIIIYSGVTGSSTGGGGGVTTSASGGGGGAGVGGGGAGGNRPGGTSTPIPDNQSNFFICTGGSSYGTGGGGGGLGPGGGNQTSNKSLYVNELSQSGPLTTGTAGSVTFTITTSNIHIGTYNVTVAPVAPTTPTDIAGISVDDVVVLDQEITIRTTASTPGGTHNIKITFDGVQSNEFPVKITAADATISFPNIGGVTPPVAGGNPVTTITSTEQYAGTVEWYNVTDNVSHTGLFAEGKVYRATITLMPKSGYTLTGVSQNYFKVADASASNLANEGVITAVFPATLISLGVQTIEITAPVTDGIPQESVADGTGYKGSTITWYNMTDLSTHTGKFVALKEYKATVSLTAKPGYKWPASLPAITVSGGTVGNYSVDNSNVEGNILTFDVTFNKTIADLDAQTIAITAPVTGGIPQVSVSDDTGYKGSTITWYNLTDLSPHTGNFSALKQYRATVSLTANTGYKWPASLPTITVLGGTVGNYSVNTSNVEENILTFDVTFSLTVSTSATLSVGIIQTGMIKESSAGTASYPVTTTGFGDGNYFATLSRTGSGTIPTGVSVQGLVTITSNIGTLTLETTNGTPSGFTNDLQMNIGGVSSNEFSLYVAPAGAVFATSVAVTGANITTDGGTSQMVANVLPSGALTNVQWSITNGTGNATISSTGLVTAIDNGTVTVKATTLDGTNKSGTLVVTISGQISESVTVGVQNGIIYAGRSSGTGSSTTYEVITTVIPPGDYPATMTGLPSGISVQGGKVTIGADHKGTLTLQGNGSQTSRTSSNLRLTINNVQSNAFSLFVAPATGFVPVTSIAVTSEGNASTITTDRGTLQMLAAVLPANATNKNVQWVVVNGTGTARISVDGLLTATGNGTVTVEAWSVDGSFIHGSKVITLSNQLPPRTPEIYGTTFMRLSEGYHATFTEPYHLAGTLPITVKVISPETKITWNNAKRRVEIAEGLDEGVYYVVLEATNEIASYQMTLTLIIGDHIYFLYLGPYSGGSVAANVWYAAEEGEDVSLTITPNDGFALNTLNAYRYDNRNVSVSLNGSGQTRNFKMPSYDVIVTASFRDMRTGIDDALQTGALQGYVQNDVLYVSGLTVGKTWSVFNTSGILIYQAIAADHKAEAMLPGRGIFIVTDGNESIKIVK